MTTVAISCPNSNMLQGNARLPNEFMDSNLYWQSFSTINTYELQTQNSPPLVSNEGYYESFRCADLMSGLIIKKVPISA
jgi:hypothetical protein